jgi:hypothetical protein
MTIQTNSLSELLKVFSADATVRGFTPEGELWTMEQLVGYVKSIDPTVEEVANETAPYVRWDFTSEFQFWKRGRKPRVTRKVNLLKSVSTARICSLKRNCSLN